MLKKLWKRVFGRNRNFDSLLVLKQMKNIINLVEIISKEYGLPHCNVEKVEWSKKEIKRIHNEIMKDYPLHEKNMKESIDQLTIALHEGNMIKE